MTAEPAVTAEPAGLHVGRAMLQRADWAARAFASYDTGTVDRVVRAAAAAAAAHADEFARRAVEETGVGVVEHKRRKNLACSTGLLEAYAGHDYVSVRVDPAAKVVEIPRPAGVVLALTSSTNPVATVYAAILLALMTRNAVVVSPHPLAARVCADAARVLAEAAVAAGAPDGCIQWIDAPSAALAEALLADERIAVVVATAGAGAGRAAHGSGSPAIGAGPGAVPVLVDASAEPTAAARTIVDSASFDNGVVGSNESVLVVEEAAADAFVAALALVGGHLLTDDERDRVRALLFPGGVLDPGCIGRDAVTLAARAGVRVPTGTRVLLAPFDLVVPEEPLAHEKLCPVLGLVRVPTVRAGLAAARAVLRISGAGHCAAVHSTDPATIVAFGAAVSASRVSVNTGACLPGAGPETNLATATATAIGTGVLGGSNLGEPLEPRHLVQHTRLAWSADATVALPDVTTPAGAVWSAPTAAVPGYPHASNAIGAGGPRS